MRSLVKGSTEKPQKVLGRQAGFTGDLLQVERLVVTLVDELACAHEPPISISVQRRGLAVR